MDSTATDEHQAAQPLGLGLSELLGAWQPIATAPNNRRILLADDYFVGEGQWYGPTDDGPDEMGNDGGFMDAHYTYFRFPRSFGADKYRDPKGLQPTHWQPLPAPPQSA